MNEPACLELVFGRVAAHFGIKIDSYPDLVDALDASKNAGLRLKIAAHPFARLFPAVRRLRRSNSTCMTSVQMLEKQASWLAQLGTPFARLVVATAPVLYPINATWSHAVVWLVGDGHSELFDPIGELEPILEPTKVSAKELSGSIEAISVLLTSA